MLGSQTAEGGHPSKGRQEVRKAYVIGVEEIKTVKEEAWRLGEGRSRQTILQHNGSFEEALTRTKLFYLKGHFCVKDHLGISGEDALTEEECEDSHTSEEAVALT